MCLGCRSSRREGAIVDRILDINFFLRERVASDIFFFLIKVHSYLITEKNGVLEFHQKLPVHRTRRIKVTTSNKHIPCEVEKIVLFRYLIINFRNKI